MKKQKIKAFLSLIFTPCVVILGGLVLLLSPDTASALLGRILGWGLVLVGIIFAAAAISQHFTSVSDIIGGVLCLGIGIWLLSNPLSLASGIGRVIGILLAVRGIADLVDALKSKGNLLPGIMTAAVGLVLVFLPMTVSRVGFRLLGLAVAVYGGLLLYLRLRRRNNTPGLDNPDIIDIDQV